VTVLKSAAPATIGFPKGPALPLKQLPSLDTPAAGSPALPARAGAALFFGGWMAVTSLIGAWMVALNETPSGAMPAAPVLRSARTAWYVLGADCGLSTTVAAQLARHAPRGDLHEQVWLLADDPEAARRLQGAGFAVERTAKAKLPGLSGLRGGPWLALFDSTGRRIFSGPFPKAWDQAEPPRGLPRFLAALAPGPS
jgi:hypothetical protein